MGSRELNVETYRDGQLIGTRVETYVTTAEQDNETSLTSRADAALADLRTIANSTGTLTTAQLSNAVRTVAKVLLVLARMALRRFDGTD